MKHALTLAVALAALTPVLAPAQHAPYAGQEAREIKALSAEEIKQYLSGAGMGLARAAELNGFPGPQHVLESAEQLDLSSEQRAATKRLMDAHKAEARVIGDKLVAAERELDRLFAGGQLNEAALTAQVKAVAALHGDYRLSHLETHRRLRAVLTAEQIRRYDHLRGYTGSRQGDSGAHAHSRPSH